MVGINFREKEKRILDEILSQGSGNSSGYDKRIRPSGVNGTYQDISAHRDTAPVATSRRLAAAPDSVMWPCKSSVHHGCVRVLML